MLKRTFRAMIVVAAGLMALGLAPANAAVSVTMDVQDGDTLFSLPLLPDGVEYPAELQTKVTGTANFSSGDGTVIYQFIITTSDGEIQYYAGQADLSSENCTSCTWSFRVPFLLPPSDYKLKVIASQPVPPVNPDDPPGVESAEQSAAVTVL